MNDMLAPIDTQQVMQREDMLAFMRRRTSIKATITEAFARAGTTPQENSIGWLSRWGWWISDDFLFQDTEARRLTKAVSDAAMCLYAALNAARQYSRVDEPEEDFDEEHKINTCLNMFHFSSDADEMTADVLLIAMRADEALNTGLVHKKGQPPLVAYYAFVRDFYEIYRMSSASVGYYKTNSGAEGEFIDLIEHAQKILPRRMRLAVRSTIGNRVLAALRESNLATD